MCRALLSGFLHHLENVILFIRTQVAFEMNFCISVQECPADYLDTPKQALSANSCTTYSYEAGGANSKKVNTHPKVPEIDLDFFRLF